MIDGGLEYLVADWTRIASEVEGRREEWTWEEGMNDLDTRELVVLALAAYAVSLLRPRPARSGGHSRTLAQASGQSRKIEEAPRPNGGRDAPPTSVAPSGNRSSA